MLDRSTYIVKEHVGMFKLTGAYDIIDPQTKETIGVAREEIPGWAKVVRLFVNKKLLPTTVTVREGKEIDSPEVMSIRRGVGIFRTPVQVFIDGRKIGEFKSKVLTIGGGFYVYDASGNQVAEVKGNWVGWDFRFLTDDGRELGRVTKKFAGIAKEFFTTADTYVISINEPGAASAALLLAAGLAIDTVYKESK